MLSDAEVDALTAGLPLEVADHLVENVIGTYALPLGIAVNFVVNGRDVLIPMVVEEPSVIAGVSNAARMVRDGDGFTAGADAPEMIAQVQLLDVPDLDVGQKAIESAREEILGEVEAASSTIVRRGGGARGLEVRCFAETPAGPMLVVHLWLDVRDAMGANLVNTAAERVAPLLESLTGGRAGLRILTNLADRRCAWARCRIPAATLAGKGYDGVEVAQGIVEANAFALVDPYRAATHNKGIMNGVDAVAVATGNDWRGIEAGAHAYAARSGRYTALTQWEMTPEGDLGGSITLPMAVGIVGGTTRAHPAARVALKILGVASAVELAGIMAAVGLAQNLAALRALVTEGIQRGHMALHARQVALATGAHGKAITGINGGNKSI